MTNKNLSTSSRDHTLAQTWMRKILGALCLTWGVAVGVVAADPEGAVRIEGNLYLSLMGSERPGGIDPAEGSEPATSESLFYVIRNRSSTRESLFAYRRQPFVFSLIDRNTNFIAKTVAGASNSVSVVPKPVRPTKSARGEYVALAP